MAEEQKKKSPVDIKVPTNIQPSKADDKATDPDHKKEQVWMQPASPKTPVPVESENRSNEGTEFRANQFYKRLKEFELSNKATLSPEERAKTTRALIGEKAKDGGSFWTATLKQLKEVPGGIMQIGPSALEGITSPIARHLGTPTLAESGVIDPTYKHSGSVGNLLQTDHFLGNMTREMGKFLLPFTALQKGKQLKQASRTLTKLKKGKGGAFATATRTENMGWISQQQVERIKTREGARQWFNMLGSWNQLRSGIGAGFLTEMMVFEPEKHGTIGNLFDKLGKDAEVKGNTKAAERWFLMAHATKVEGIDDPLTTEKDLSKILLARFKGATEGAFIGGFLNTAIHGWRFGAAHTRMLRNGDKLEKLQQKFTSSNKTDVLENWKPADRKEYEKLLKIVLKNEETAFKHGIALEKSYQKYKEGSAYSHAHSGPLSKAIELDEKNLIEGNKIPTKDRETYRMGTDETYRAMERSVKNEGADFRLLDETEPADKGIIEAKEKFAGRRVGAWYRPGGAGEKDKVFLDRGQIDKMWEEKAWLNPKVEEVRSLKEVLEFLSKKHGPDYVTRFSPETVFRDKGDFIEWLVEHELVHHRVKRKGLKLGKRADGKPLTKADEENAVNLFALNNLIKRHSGQTWEGLVGNQKVYDSNLSEEFGTLWRVHGDSLVLDEKAIKADYENNLSFLNGSSRLDGSYLELQIISSMGLDSMALKRALESKGGSEAYLRFYVARSKALKEIIADSGGLLPSMGSKEGIEAMMVATKKALVDPKHGLGIPEQFLTPNFGGKLKTSFLDEGAPRLSDIFDEKGIKEFRKYFDGTKPFTSMGDIIADLQKSGVFNPETIFGPNVESNRAIAGIINLLETELKEVAKSTTREAELHKMLGMAENMDQAKREVFARSVMQELHEAAALFGTTPENLKRQILDGSGAFEGLIDAASTGQFGSSKHILELGELSTLHTRLGAVRLVMEADGKKIYKLAEELNKFNPEELQKILKEGGEVADGTHKELIEKAHEFQTLVNKIQEDLVAVKKARRSWGLAGQALQRDVLNAQGAKLLDEDTVLGLKLHLLDSDAGGMDKVLKAAQSIAQATKAGGADAGEAGLRALNALNKTGFWHDAGAFKLEAMINAMLSGLKTQSVNVVTTALRTYWTVANIKLGGKLHSNPVTSPVMNFFGYTKKYLPENMTPQQFREWNDVYADAMFSNLTDVYLTFIKQAVRGDIIESSGETLAKLKESDRAGRMTAKDYTEITEEGADAGVKKESKLEGRTRDGGVAMFDLDTGEYGFNVPTLLNMTGGSHEQSLMRRLGGKKVQTALGVGKGGRMDSVLEGLDFWMRRLGGAPVRSMVTTDEMIKQTFYRSSIKSTALADMRISGIVVTPENAAQIGKQIDDIVDMATLKNGNYFTQAGLLKEALGIKGISESGVSAYLRNFQMELFQKTGMKPDELEDMATRAFRSAKETAHQRGADWDLKELNKPNHPEFARKPFTERGYSWGNLTKVAQEAIGSHPLFGSVQPFVLTPSNLFKFVGQHTAPVNWPGIRSAHTRMMANLNSGNPEQVAEASGRLWAGSALWMMGWTLAKTGLTTGAGPQNPNERAVAKDVVEPWSIRTPNGFISYNRADPISMFIGVPAAIYEAQNRAVSKKEKILYGEYAKLMALCFADAAFDKTYMRNVASLVEAIVDSDKKGEQWLKDHIAAHVPVLAKDFNKGIDGRFRETIDYIDQLNVNVFGVPFFQKEMQKPNLNQMSVDSRKMGSMGRIEYKFDWPKSRSYYPPERNVLGEARVKRGDATFQLIDSMFNFAKYTPYNTDPVALELAAIMYPSGLPDTMYAGIRDLDRAFAFARLDKLSVKAKGDALVYGIKEGQSIYDFWQDLTSTITLAPQDLVGKKYNRFKVESRTVDGKEFFRLEKDPRSKHGLTLRGALEKLIASDYYQSLPTETNVDSGIISPRIAEIDKVVQRYRNTAWKWIVGKPDLEYREGSGISSGFYDIKGFDGIMQTYWPHFAMNYLIHQGSKHVDKRQERMDESSKKMGSHLNLLEEMYKADKKKKND